MHQSIVHRKRAGVVMLLIGMFVFSINNTVWAGDTSTEVSPQSDANSLGATYSAGYYWAIEVNKKLDRIHEQGNMIQTAVQRQKKRIFRLQGLLILSVLLNITTLIASLLIFQRSKIISESVFPRRGGEDKSNINVNGDGKYDNKNHRMNNIRKVIVIQAVSIMVIILTVVLLMFVL